MLWGLGGEADAKKRGDPVYVIPVSVHTGIKVRLGFPKRGQTRHTNLSLSEAKQVGGVLLLEAEKLEMQRRHKDREAMGKKVGKKADQ